MPLKGTIESFGISEIFQLIDHQSKTGTLEINTGLGIARLRFLDGNLVEAWPEKRSPGELIGELLVRSGHITPTQLSHALDMQRQSLRRLGDILIRMGAIRVSEFQEVLALQHRDTVYRLLRLNRGKFQFLAGPVEIEEGVSVPMEISSLLMEGFRQIDEWPQLTEKIPSEKKIYARVQGTPPPENLTREESRVLALVDGTATVRDVVDKAYLGEFAGWEALCGLFDRGLITPVRSARRTRTEDRPVKVRRLTDWVAALVLLGFAASVLAFSATRGIHTTVRLERAYRGAREEAQQIVRRSDAWVARPPPSWPDPEVLSSDR